MLHAIFHMADLKDLRRISWYYDVRMQKHVSLQFPYSTQLLTYTENAIPIPGTPAPPLDIHNTSTPKLITIMLERVRQEPM
jgi:hypothetical protein